MKKVIVAISVLLIIVVAGILENVYVDKVFDELDGGLSNLEGYVQSEDEEALPLLREVISKWENRRKYLELFTYSPDLRAFSVALGETEGSLECGDYQNAQSKVQSLLVMSDNIHRVLDFNFEDII